jgi:hypothetical protein
MTMNWKTIPSICNSVIFLSVLLVGCDLSKPISSYKITDTPISNPILFSTTELENATNCWLQSFDLHLGDWVGDHQCTAIARLLTTAPGYGKNANGNALGGYDYVKQLQNYGKHVPLLAEVKNDLKPCDNLILVGQKYDSVGHTVVVFSSDLPNNKVYYLDQNYNGDAIAFRQLSIKENENYAYVIPAKCKKPIKQSCSYVAKTLVIFPTPTSMFRQTSFILPNDGKSNNNQSIGPFCCTGHTATVVGNDGYAVGYIYFYAWDGQAYNVGNNRSIAPNIKILMSGLKDLSMANSTQQESSVFFSANEMINGNSRSTQAGSLYYTATIDKANLVLQDNLTYFDMGSVVVRVDVSLAIP